MATEADVSTHALDLGPRFFPSLAPTLMISMGFLDLGKWVVAVEAGAQFGFNPVLLVLLFNCSAIFCQYLATCIGAVTGKNLAQICSEEYCKPACLLLGMQAKISWIVSEISIIIGIAHGINLLCGGEILVCTFAAAIVNVTLPISVKLLGSQFNEKLYVSISGFLLLFYVLRILAAQPDVPVVTTGTFPRLSWENSFLVMAMLGSNVIVHNFYSQSSMVQQQRRCSSVPINHLIHDHLFAILFIFSGLFLANCVLMNSATSLFENAGPTFQDVIYLMDQMSTIFIAPIVFFLVLLLSSLVSAITWVLEGQKVIDDLLGIDASFWAHLTCSKVLVAVPAIYYAQAVGSEELYQLLILCQVILAVLLPSSVIPLFRVASSKPLMGTSIMSWHLEILALFTFIWMFSSNLVFVIEIFFGNGSWIITLRSGLMLPYVFLLLVACISVGLTLYLIVTPLKSASNELKWEFQNAEQLHNHGNNSHATDYYEAQETETEPASFGFVEFPVLDFNLDKPEVTSDLHKEYETPTDLNLETASTSSASDIAVKESNFPFDLQYNEPDNKLTDSCKADSEIPVNIEPVQPVEEKARVEPVEGTYVKESSWEQADFPEESLPSVTGDSSVPPKDSMPKTNDAGSGIGSLSRLSGLGRAARRQFAATLDEFWGHLFDFHGQLTPEARTNKMDVLLGLELKSISPTKTDASTSEGFRKHMLEKERGTGFQTNIKDDSFPNQMKIPNRGSPYALQAGSPSWLSTQQAALYGQRSSNDLMEPGDRRYSSLHMPQHSDTRDYQPATIHGYQISSYLRGLGADRLDSSAFSFDQPSFSPKSPESFIPNYADQHKYGMERDAFGSMRSSGFERQRFSETSRHAELSSYDLSLSGIYDDFEKKHHSLPDISGLIVSSRNSSSNNRNFLQGGRIGPRPSIGRAIGQSQFINPSYRAEGTPLTFDELSPSPHYKDIFSSQSTSVADTRSLWSRQPYEQLFGLPSISQAHGDASAVVPSLKPEAFSYLDLELKLLKSFKDSMSKILKLEGSDWLFRQNAGADEELIDQIVLKEKFLNEIGMNEMSTNSMNEHQHLSSDDFCAVHGANLDLRGNETIVKCGESCTWRAGLIVSFGVWCIRRILELSLVESRPELWGKYTYVLNRLQGILEPAFLKSRSTIVPCPCLEIPVAYMKDYDNHPQSSFLQKASMLGGSRCTTSGMILDLIKDVEVAISGRKGRSGTAAGDVAFPKGKENLASVLKRYKRRLSNKSSGANQSSASSRKFPLPTSSVL